jgi:hypothetical protein
MNLRGSARTAEWKAPWLWQVVWRGSFCLHYSHKILSFVLELRVCALRREWKAALFDGEKREVEGVAQVRSMCSEVLLVAKCMRALDALQPSKHFIFYI